MMRTFNRYNQVRLGNHFLLIVMIASISACHRANTNLSAPLYPAEATHKLLLDYLQSPTAEKRHQIRDASGVHEILASRVYRSFEIYSAHGFGNDDRMQFDRASNDLRENIQYSLWALKPMLYEVPAHGAESEWHEQASIYIGLCTAAASVERDEFAHSILSQLSKHPDPAVADHAYESLQWVAKGENYAAKSKSYKESGDWNSLNWLYLNYVRQNMRRSEIEDVLGKGTRAGYTTYAYSGKLSSGEIRFLSISYSDDLLQSTSWQAAVSATDK